MSSKVYSEIKRIPDGLATGGLTEGCLVLEGGAFRGVYSEGVMDLLMQKGINFQCVIGVSAGAMSGTCYMSGQIGRAARINLGQRHNPDYVGAKAALKSRSIIRLDYPLRDYDKVEPLRMDKLLSDDRRFVAVATNLNTGAPAYLEKDNCSDIITAVKASASMPVVSPIVYLDGEPYLDGGCSAKIPYQWALHEGYKKVVIVRTRERGYRKKVRRDRIADGLYSKYPNFVESLDNCDAAYNKLCDDIEEQEKLGRVFTIYPSETVTVKRVEPDVEKLGHLYWLGYYDMLNKLKELKEYLEK